MAETDSLRQVAQSRAPFSAWLGILILFALFGLIVLALIGPSPRTDNYEQARAQKRAEVIKTVRDEEAKLTTYAWIDKEKGIAQIPINRAMQIMGDELAKQKPAPANPIATPAAAAPPAGAALPASAPAASATPAGTPKAKAIEGPESQNRNQPAAANNPPAAPPGTQPGVSATPAASPAAPSGKPAVAPTGTPPKPIPGTPSPVPAQSP